MSSQKKFLFFGLVPALLFQLFAAYFYFDLLAEKPIAKIIYSTTKILILVWPLLWWKAMRTPLRIKPKKTLTELAYGLATGALLCFGILMTFHFFPGKEIFAEQIQEKVESYFGMSAALYLFFSLFLCFGHSLLEEYYWRWFASKGLAQFIGVTPAQILSNVAFASHHFIILNALTTSLWAVLGTIGVFTGGLIWSLLYQKNKTLFSAWISHICVDATLMGIGYFLLFQ